MDASIGKIEEKCLTDTSVRRCANKLEELTGAAVKKDQKTETTERELSKSRN